MLAAPSPPPAAAQVEAAAKGCVKDIVLAQQACTLDEKLQEQACDALATIVEGQGAAAGAADDHLAAVLCSQGAIEAIAFYSLKRHPEVAAVQRARAQPASAVLRRTRCA